MESLTTSRNRLFSQNHSLGNKTVFGYCQFQHRQQLKTGKSKTPIRLPFRNKSCISSFKSPAPGRYSTYGLLATHLKSYSRAVGNASRNNRFAPDAPCHRVLATGGGIGGLG